MHRFKINPEDINGEILLVKEREAHHLSKVLRLTSGDKIEAFDNSGAEYTACIESVNSNQVVCRILEVRQTQNEPSLKVFLLQGLPKADKMELVVQKTTELGIHMIIPVRTSRAVVQLEGKKALDRVARWQKIAEEAAKQCGRSLVPKVAPLVNLAEAVRLLPPGTLLLAAYEAETTMGLKEALRGRKPEAVALVVGPEGGFEPQEIKELQAAGALSISLGPRILRTETAGLAALSMILYELGDLGSVSN